MKKILVKSTSLVLLLVMIFAMAAGPVSAAVSTTDNEATKVELGVETNTYTHTLFCFDVPAAGTLTIAKGPNSGGEITYTLYASEADFEAGTPLKDQTYDTIKDEIELTKGGTYYIVVQKIRTFKLTFEQKSSNETVKNPKAVTVAMGKSITLTQERSDGTHQYYSLSPDDKSYYKFELLNGSGVEFFDSKGNRINKNTVADVLSGKSKKVAVNAGKKTFIFGIFGSKSEGAASVKITRTDFIDIKKISFAKSTYTVSGSGAITLKADLGKDVNGKAITKAFESTLTYTVKDSNGKTVKNFVTADKKNKLKVTVGNDYNTGIYTLYVKTSEGKTASATVRVAPGKMDLKTGTSSEGTVNSSTVKWAKQDGADLYYIYLLKDGKFVKTGQSTTTSYTFKNLKADTTYSFKISAVKKAKQNGKVVYLVGDQSQVWKFITAKTTKPTLKSASCSSCKYTAGKSVSGHWDAGGVWHAGYKTNAYSTATIKVSVTAIKGASFYANSGSQIKNGAYTITFSGKKTSSTEKVKVRACYALSAYNSTAFGPWSAEKSVKIPAAK